MPFTPPRVGRILPAAFCRLPRIAAAARCALLAGVLAGDGFAAAPQILTPPQPVEVSFRESAALTVQTAGEGVTLQWYSGTSGDVSAPVPGATGAFLLSQPLIGSASFWVRASNADGHTDSSAVTVSVRAPVSGTLKGMGANYYRMLFSTNDNSMVPKFILTGATGISAGVRHNLIIKEDKSLWATGDNTFYQLGIDPPYSADDPRQLVTGVAHAAAGGFHSLYIKYDRTLWGMGRNSDGQMGDGTTDNRTRAYQIASWVADAAGGEEHSAWVTDDGNLWTTGSNHSGQLGDGSTTERHSPVQVASGVARVYTGSYHTLFIKTDGSLWGTGFNEYGQLGDGSRENRLLPVKIAEGVVSAAGGHGHTLYRSTGNSLHGAGRNFSGQLGLPGTGATGDRLVPETIAQNVKQVACGAFHSLYITTDNVLHTMGGNQFGVLGDGTEVERYEPYSTGLAILATGRDYHSIFIDGSPLISTQPQDSVIISGKTATFSVDAGGGGPFTYQWYRGQPGDTSRPGAGATSNLFTTPIQRADTAYWVRISNPYGYTDSAAAQALVTTKPVVRSMPKKLTVPHLGNAVLKTVVAGNQLSYQWYQGKKGNTSQPVTGASSSMLVTPPLTANASFWLRATNAAGRVDSAPVTVTVSAPIRGRLMATGHNHGGQLGNGTRVASTVFQEIATDVASLAAGNDRSFFTKGDGSFWAIGENSNGQLGDGTATDRLLPVQLPTPYATASGRSSITYFLKTDGTIWRTSRNVLSNVVSVTKIGDGFASISTSGFFMIALKTDGSLWGMGSNSDGQLGQGNREDAAELVRITGDVVKAVAGGSHTLFIRKDGSLWGTGDSDEGQVGVKDYFSDLLPLQLVPSGVTDIAAGGAHSLYVKSDGSLWGMGSDSSGQLGDGEGEGTPGIPVQITTGVVRVAAGSYHSMFLKSNGEFRMMGSNSHGQLGDGTKIACHEPLLVSNGVVDFTGSSFNTFIIEGRPTILEHPQPIVVVKGKRGQLSAAAASSAPVTWQWYIGESGDTSLPIARARKAIYRTAAVKESYRVWARVTNRYGYTDTASAPIEMVTKPVLATIASSISVRYGDHAILPVSASGGVLTYTWYEGAPGNTSKPVATISQGTLVTRPMRSPASLWVRVSNAAGAVNSGAIPIFILPREATHLTTAGRNQYGQLGNGTSQGSPVRVRVASRVVKAAGGVFNTYFLKDDGTLWGMGYNHVGQLGRPPTTTETLPVQIATDVIDVVGGNVYILFVKSDGSLWGLGYNNHGQLGTGDWMRRIEPVQIATDVVQAAAGEAHSIFVKSDGSAWATGRDTDGEQGNGPDLSGDVFTPVQIASGVAAAAAGEHHTMLLKCDGSLWAAGLNNQGQLGDGSSTSRVSFVRVGTDIRAVACGEEHTLVRKMDDSLWKLAQTSSQLATGVELMAAGVGYSLFITREGNLYGVGNNENGQLGDGSLAARSTPVLLGKAYAVACGDYHSAVLDGRAVITTQPAAATVESGQSVELSVSAIGPGPLTYQWYRGEAGDDSQPLEGAVASSFSTGSLIESSAYWVRVGNPYGDESSLGTTVTVTATAPAQASPASPASPAYRIWAARETGTGELLDPRADADGDGWTNLMEYAFASDPHVAGGTPYTLTIQPGGAESTLVLAHRRAIGAAVTFIYEWSEDLANWEAFTPQISVLPEDSQAERITASRPIAAGERSGFVRVRVSGN
jgi:alpha-tubulin suppressor-like RCC1 family protein